MNQMLSLLNGTHASIDDLTISINKEIEEGGLLYADSELKHFHIPGGYGRWLFMQAGAIVTSRVHNFHNITAVLLGSCYVVDHEGNKEIKVAGEAWVTEPGTQRALHIIEDSIWMTFHLTDLTDPNELYETLTSATMADYKLKFLEKAS